MTLEPVSAMAPLPTQSSPGEGHLLGITLATYPTRVLLARAQEAYSKAAADQRTGNS